MLLLLSVQLALAAALFRDAKYDVHDKKKITNVRVSYVLIVEDFKACILHCLQQSHYKALNFDNHIKTCECTGIWPNSALQLKNLANWTVAILHPKVIYIIKKYCSFFKLYVCLMRT